MSIATRSVAGRAVNPVGLGCMNLSHAYGPPPPREVAAALLRRALDLGATHFDTAALYGFGANETLVGEVLSSHRDAIFLASKCGMTGVDGKRVIDGSPATLKRTCDDALTRLCTDHIDLYYLHRWDKNVPIEESVGALADLVRAGKIGAIGLSEVSAATLRKAHAVHPIAALQTEYSLFTRNPEIAALKACEELGVAFVAFSPLARGMLADDLTGEYSPRDIRLTMPRFNAPNLDANRRLAARLATVATKHDMAPGQLALAWVLARSPAIHVIPGTTSIAHLEENVAAAGKALSGAVLTEIDAVFAKHKVSGPRYAPAAQADVDTEEFNPPAA